VVAFLAEWWLFLPGGGWAQPQSASTGRTLVYMTILRSIKKSLLVCNYNILLSKYKMTLQNKKTTPSDCQTVTEVNTLPELPTCVAENMHKSIQFL
jgi:hypothetical protein